MNSIRFNQVKHLTDFKNLYRQAMFQYKNYSKETIDPFKNQIIVSLSIIQYSSIVLMF